MIVDCHVHTCACVPGHGSLSPSLFNSLVFRFVRWRLGLRGMDQATEASLNASLAQIIDETPGLDAAVVLAFDAVHDDEGRLDAARTHLYVTNDHVMELARQYPKMLFGASVHPYRRDAVAELERCIRGGAALMKWLPITQDFNPADPRCFPLYEAMAHHGLPLLSHTGGEQSLPSLDKSVADPALLLPALERGVTVIAAHCGTRSRPGEADFVPTFVRMAKEHERLYGDTSAFNLPTRWYAYGPILSDPVVRDKLVHGSDWPIVPVPPPRRVGWRRAGELMRDPNWLRRDLLIKRDLGFDEAYWRRGAALLRMGSTTETQKAQREGKPQMDADQRR